MTKRQLLQYIRESVRELLSRKMPGTYQTFPANWDRLGFASIMSHANRLHYSDWTDDLKMAVNDYSTRS